MGWLPHIEEALRVSLAGLVASVALNRERNDGVSMDDKAWFITMVKQLVKDVLGLPADTWQGIAPLGLIDSDPDLLASVWRRKVSLADRERAFGDLFAQAILGLNSAGAAGAHYDAREHFLLARTAWRLGLSSECVLEYETLIAELIESGVVSNNKVELTEHEKEEKSRWHFIRNLKVGAAAVVGATLVGVTGGLALPAIGASLAAFGGAAAATGTFVASTAGTALFTTLFAGGGLGLTSYKMTRRLGGLRDFSFLELPVPPSAPTRGNGLHIVICVSGWYVSPETAALLQQQHQQHKQQQQQQEKRVEPTEAPKSTKPSGSYETCLIRELSKNGVLIDDGESAESSTTSAAALAMPSPPCAADEPNSVQRQHSTSSRSAKSEEGGGGGSISGGGGGSGSDSSSGTTNTSSSNSNTDALRNSEWVLACATHRARLGQAFELRWDSEGLKDVSNALSKFALNQAVTTAVTEVLSTTTLAAIMSAIAWPAMVVSSFDYIDNSWAVSVNRAKLAGEELARAILAGAQGRRPVTLIGYSLGGLVVFTALEYIARKRQAKQVGPEADGIVLDAFVLGAPVTATPQQWRAVRGVVAGSLVNGYAPNDWILAVLFRASLVSVAKIAGLYRVGVPGVQDIDLSEPGIISTQVDYHRRIYACVAHVTKYAAY
jgi:hypothetical protein